MEAKLDRLGALEERQQHQTKQLDKHENRLEVHDGRISALETSSAVRSTQTDGRWSTVSRVLGVVTSVASSVSAALLLYYLGVK